MRSYLLKLAFLAFLTPWFWEMLQMPAYSEMADQPWAKTAGTCALATFGDLTIIGVVYSLIAVKNENWRWGLTPARIDSLIAALICAGVAITLEKVAISQGHWSYTDAMPRLPGNEIGLPPFVQLSVVIPVTLAVSHRWLQAFKAGERFWPALVQKIAAIEAQPAASEGQGDSLDHSHGGNGLEARYRAKDGRSIQKQQPMKSAKLKDQSMKSVNCAMACC